MGLWVACRAEGADTEGWARPEACTIKPPGKAPAGVLIRSSKAILNKAWVGNKVTCRGGRRLRQERVDRAGVVTHLVRDSKVKIYCKLQQSH